MKSLEMLGAVTHTHTHTHVFAIQKDGNSLFYKGYSLFNMEIIK